MKNRKRLTDLIEIETRGVSSDCPVTCSRSWVAVADVMSRNVATVSPEATVVSAARMMSERKISCLAVMSRGNVAGILTENGHAQAGRQQWQAFLSDKVGPDNVLAR